MSQREQVKRKTVWTDNGEAWYHHDCFKHSRYAWVELGYSRRVMVQDRDCAGCGQALDA